MNDLGIYILFAVMAAFAITVGVIDWLGERQERARRR